MKTFELMPDHARVWIYHADRFLSPDEEALITKLTTDFIQQWSSHGAAMDASFSIFFQRIVVITANEDDAQASGCGIDKSVHFMKDLGGKLGVDFFQRTAVLFQQNNEWRGAQMHEFWGMRKALIVNDETSVVDTTIRTFGQLKREFVKPFKLSWHAEMWGR
jgi:hypothetical protein